MGTPIEGGQVQGDNSPGDGGENAPGPNPAWNDVLSVIPEQFHSQITPHFQRWDQAANQRVESVNSQLKQFEGYNPFVENGITPQELEQGLRLMWEINNNPRDVYTALGKAYNLVPETNQPQTIPPPGNEGDGNQQQLQDPRYDELRQGIELVSKIVLENQQQKVAAEADAALEREMSALQEKYKDQGGFDERYVLALMQNDMSAEDAAQAYFTMKNQIMQNNPRPFAPNVMGNSGGGAGYPSQAIDPTKLNGQETRNLVAQMLAAAAQQNR